MPLALFVLVFDGFSLPGRALLGGGAPRRCERPRMRRKALLEGAVDRIGPAIFVAEDFVGDMSHRFGSVGRDANRCDGEEFRSITVVAA